MALASREPLQVSTRFDGAGSKDMSGPQTSPLNVELLHLHRQFSRLGVDGVFREFPDRAGMARVACLRAGGL